ncbi:MAG: transglutaminase TgpA family protein [Pseudomonadota bacterium]
MSHDREQRLTPPSTGRIWLIGALFLAVIPHLLRMPVWLSAFCLSFFVWRALHEWRGYDLPGRFLRYALVVTGVGMVLLAHRTLLGLEAGVALLVMMLCLKLLELQTMRDAMIALFIGYFTVIAGFLFDQSIFMGGYLFLVVLALTAALIALNHPGGGSAYTRFYLTSGGKLLLQALPLMVVMFVLFPRLSSPLWSMPERSSSAKTGLSDSIEMGSISNLVESEEVAFRVNFDGPIPDADALYWRGPVLWQTDGRRWERRRMRPQQEVPAFLAEGGEVAYSVILEPHQQRWIFTLDLPLSRPEGSGIDPYFLPDFQILNGREIKKKRQYSLRSATRYRLDSEGLVPELEFAALELPDEANPRSRKLAREWRSEGLDDAAIVARGVDYFREQPFYYSQQPPRLGSDPVDGFLFDSRRGFCEHYATAYVTLMRAADIPARVVTGYQGGELNELGNYLVIRQSNAHAWAEVWLEGEGWRRVDPTTAIPPSRVEVDINLNRRSGADAGADLRESALLSRLMQQARNGWDAINHSWDIWILGFDHNRQRQLLEKLGLNKLSWEWLIGLMVGVIAAILGLITAITLLRRPRQRDPLVRLYQRFCRKLERAGIRRDLNEGPADFAERACHERPELAAAIRQITRLYIRLRYTRHRGGKDWETLRRLVRGFRA